MNNYRWMKIDTASIMFSSLTTKSWGRTFRFSATMKNGEIKPDILKQAVADVMPFYPSMFSCLKKGFFWNYLEVTDVMPEIREEYSQPLLPITRKYDGRPNFRLVYCKERVAIEASHSLGDGKGVMRFFMILLRRYIELLNGETKPFESTFSIEDMSVNAFDTYFNKGGEKTLDKPQKAFQFEKNYVDNYLKLLFALMPVSEVKELAHREGMTVTEYISAVLILGTIRATKEPINKPVSIAVPVNLRRFFPTRSVRNFTIEASVSFSPNGKRDYTLKDICDATSGQLKAQLTTDNLQRSLNKFGSLVANPVIKIIPNAIKNPALSLIQDKSHGSSTTIFTNFGNCELPSPLCENIERLEFTNGDTRNYGLPVTCSCISYNNVLSLCFSMANKDISWVRECINILTEEGVRVRIESTDRNGENRI